MEPSFRMSQPYWHQFDHLEKTKNRLENNVFRGNSLKKWKIVDQMPCPFTGPKMFCAGPNFL